MTIEEKAKAYDEVLERVKPLYEWAKKDDSPMWSTYEYLFPQLAESEDERIRKELIDFFDSALGKDLLQRKCGLNPDAVLAYLEKQKDASKAIEAVERIDKYIDQHLANAHDMKDSNPDKKYYRGWDDALGKMAGILQDVYSGEKQKESLRDFIDDFPYSDQKEQKSIENEDERIRKALINYFKAHSVLVGENWNGIECDDVIAYLEKQKEPENTSASTMIPSFYEELTEFELVLFNAVLDNNFVGAKGSKNALAMTKKVAPELLAIAKKEPDWDREKCFVCQEYEKGFKQGHLEGCTAGYNKAMKEVDEQKEPHFTKRNALFDKCVENCDPKTVEEVNKRVDDIMNMPELSAFEQALTNFIGYWEDDEERWPSKFVKKHGKHILDMAREELQKEQKPNFDTHWENGSVVYEQKEQKPLNFTHDEIHMLDVVIDIFEDTESLSDDKDLLKGLYNIRSKILKYEQKEQKPAEKQDYSGLNDLERAIHRGFLSAGVENVPVTIIKETANECKWTQTIANENANAEWSDEDRLHYTNVLGALEYVKGCKSDYDKIEAVKSDIAWLKSLRPQSHCKPSEGPVWRIWENGACGNSDGIPIALVKRGSTYRLVSCLGAGGEKYIMLSDLKKLPGFDEGEEKPEYYQHFDPDC